MSRELFDSASDHLPYGKSGVGRRPVNQSGVGRRSVNAEARSTQWFSSIARAPDHGRHDPYTAHQLVWNLFRNHRNQKRDFLYRMDLVGGRPFYRILSRRPPQPPGAGWRLEMQLYQPRYEPGSLLTFQLRINPAVCIEDQAGRRSRRRDLVSLRLGGQPADSHALTAIALEWLGRRTDDPGFCLDPNRIMADSWEIQHFRDGKRRKNITISTMYLQGVLRVSDSDRFAETLVRGIGRARGFGCGLLLVVPLNS